MPIPSAADELPYRDLFHSLETGFCVFELLFDENGAARDARIVETNAHFERMMGRADLAGRTFLDLFTGIDASWFRIYQEAFEKRKPVRFEKHHAPSDHWYELFASPFGPPETRRVAVVFNNISERKRAEEALKGFNARLESEVEARTAQLKKALDTLRITNDERRRAEEEKIRFALERRDLEERQRQELLTAILETQETERKRIAESLHNGIGQLLYGVQLNLGRIGLEPGETWREDHAELQRQTMRLLGEAISESRRVSHELMPSVLEDFGLMKAVDELCGQFQGRLKVDCKHSVLPDTVPQYISIAIYRTLQELMTNIVKHSGAGRARVSLRHHKGFYELEVSDDGVGFDVHRPAKGIGLKTLREKVALLKGEFHVDSGKSGTTLRVRLPHSPETHD